MLKGRALPFATVLFLTWESLYLLTTVFLLRRGPGAENGVVRDN